MYFASTEYELLTPSKDIVELAPEKYWEAVCDSILKVVKDSGVDSRGIKVVTFTTQGETLIPVDKEGNALHNALVWLDARAAEESEAIGKGIGREDFYRHTGLPEAGPACPAAKVLWFKNKKPELFDKVYKILLLEDFLIYKFTGEFVTERSLMSSTGYFDVHRNALWERTLEVLGVGAEYFPEILQCGTRVGLIREDVADGLGLKQGAVVSTGAMDQISSAIGAGNIVPGVVTETTGTALVIAATVERPKFDAASGMSYYRHYNQQFLMLPYNPTAGIVLKWFKDEFCREEIEASRMKGISVYEMLDGMAERVVPLSGGMLVIPHFAGKLSPDINPHARGVFFGVGLDTKKEHFIGAILESIGYMLKENIEAVEQIGVKINEIRSLGGGSRSRLWNSVKADICEKDILTMAQDESTSLGAAMLGAVSVGLYKSIEEACGNFVRIGQVFKPDESHFEMYRKGYRLYQKLYGSLNRLFKERV